VDFRIPDDDEAFAMFLLAREFGEKELPYGLSRKEPSELFDETGRVGAYEYRMQTKTCVNLGLSPEERALLRRLLKKGTKIYFFGK
jgi:hypothetical protein